MTTHISLQAAVPEDLSGNRLDQIAAKLFPEYSRARLQGWIKDGSLKVNGRILKSKDKLPTGDLIRVEAEMAAATSWVAEPLALDIVFEDEHLLVLNKGVGMVVHPAAGNRDGTLLNGLLHYFPQLNELPRAGMVHRLDKDTTGLMVVAKSLKAHTGLVKLLQTRNVTREYEAVLKGVLTGGGTVDKPLGRHPVNRKKRAVTETGQIAVTHYRVITKYRAFTHVQVNLETGRTHQIRVHMASVNHALVGDPMYGGRLQLPAACSPALADYLHAFRRQALHARKLALVHPVTQQELTWEVPRPADMEKLLLLLAADSNQKKAP
ncbi:MAG: 23S rRNA pseudouridine(1911/1915/1917) synthase RluD [Gammaproteobacteria bacterium]|nr:23S rRNA pseudouridine(1911/1915/1917) synthase RluD [Gammaproteobacteria bacterium]